MGYTHKEVDFFQVQTRFVNVLTDLWRRTSTLWQGRNFGWMVKSLHGPKATPGPYHYLVEEVKHSDVAALYQQLIRVIDTPTMVSQANDLAAVFQYTSLQAP